MDLIIGAGITGLAYASMCGHEDYQIIEKTDGVGGYCKTIKQDGFTWDYSGHFFHFKNQEIKKFVLDNMDPSQLVECVKQTKIYYKGKYIDFPFQKNIHQLDKQEFIECLYDLFTTGDKDVHSFKDMVYNELGRAISDKFLIPYNEKLYACDLNELDKDAMGRFFPKAKKEDIVRNFKNPDNSGYNSTFTYPRGGAIEYTNSLLSRLDKDKIHLNEELISIDVEKQVAKTNKREIPYSRLISTVPFPQIITKTQGGGELDCSWNKVLVFNLGFDCKGADKANHWIYFPSKEIRFYRIGYYDNIMNTEKMSLYVEIGFGKNEEIDTQHELKKVLGDLLKTGVTNSDQKLISYHSVLMDPAYVHISNDSQAKVEEAKRELALSNIYSIGRYGSWTYCSIEDNIIEAKSLAYEIN